MTSYEMGLIGMVLFIFGILFMVVGVLGVGLAIAFHTQPDTPNILAPIIGGLGFSVVGFVIGFKRMKEEAEGKRV